MSNEVSNNMPMVDKIKFIDFWSFITVELGDSRCLLNSDAKRLAELFAGNSGHRAFLSDVVQQSYTRCRCRHLKDYINVNTVLDVLGETAYSLQGEQADDLLDIELLEEICWLICQRYPNCIDIPTVAKTHNGTRDSSAAVVSLPEIKIRIANSRV